MVRRVIDTCRAAFAKRAELLSGSPAFPDLPAEVRRLIPADFPARVPHDRLPHMLRYLDAIAARAAKARQQPGRDRERAALVDRYRDWPAKVPPAQHEAFRWLLEEYRVSVFAQELGTAQPVSDKRLDTFLATD
jgi:ATP-dependent helicase HrpA